MPISNLFHKGTSDIIFQKSSQKSLTQTNPCEDRKEVCGNDNFVPYSALLQSVYCAHRSIRYCMVTISYSPSNEQWDPFP